MHLLISFEFMDRLATHAVMVWDLAVNAAQVVQTAPPSDQSRHCNIAIPA